MKLLLDLNGEHLEVDFALSNGLASLTVGERRCEARLTEPEPNLFVVVIDGRIFRCVLDRLPGGSTELTVNGKRLAISVRDRKHLRVNTNDRGASSGRETLRAPMAGKVVRVLCAQDEEVEAGQGLLIVEAMKMQNEVVSPRAGKVVEMRVTDGQTVNAGDVLAVVE